MRSVYVYKFDMAFNINPSREERMRKPIAFEDSLAIREHCPAVESVAQERRMRPCASQRIFASPELFFVMDHRRVNAGKRLTTKLLRTVARLQAQ